jgi:hypothetical protein
MPQKMARAGGYSRLRALILASVVEASANNFMAVLATSLYRAAVVMVGAAGQRIRTAGGASAGSTSSTLSVSPDWLMAPPARGVMGCLGKAELTFRLGPGSGGGSPPGADLCGCG